MLSRIYFTGSDSYQWLSFDNNDNKKVTNWISTAISAEKSKPFGSSLSLIKPNLVNAKVSIRFNNSVLVQQKSSSYVVISYINIYLVYELNILLHTRSHNVTLKNCLVQSI